MTDNTINNDMTMGGPNGALLAGRYRVVKQLGQGGMGSVWLAEDVRLDGFKVAIKMLPSVLVNNKRAYAQVKAEALVSLKLSHPNIVTVRAFEEEGGNPFLVMDYIDGQTLDDYLAEKGKLTEEETVKLLKPVAAALDYAHTQGVVHRDVKPGNVMIRKDGVPFVLDFGIAREIQETMTRVTGKLSSGTLLYMSPEQLNGEKPTPAQDIYSFAAMAYECLKGEPPFSRGGVEDQIKHKTPEPLPRNIAICLSVAAGLEKKIGDRPSTCLSVLSVGSRVPRDRANAGVPAGKTRGGLIVAALLALAGIGAAVWFSGKARTPSSPQVPESQSVARDERPTPIVPAVVTQVIEKVVEKPATQVSPTVDAEADRRRREELAKLTKIRTKITIKVAAAKEDYAKVAPYRAERDGFETHLAEIDRQWKVVEVAQTPETLAEAEKTLATITEAADAIAFELNWLVTNRDGRDAAKRLEKEITDSIEPQLRNFKADDVAKSQYDKGQSARKAAAAALSRGEFTSARRQYETAKATLSTALAEARQFHIKTTLAAASEYKNAARWQSCIDEAKKVLGWDPQNAEALALKKEAESALEPTVYLTASLDGIPRTATVIEGMTQPQLTTPLIVHLKDLENQRWSCKVRYVQGGITYEGVGSCLASPGRQTLDVKLHSMLKYCRHCGAKLADYANVGKTCPACNRNLLGN